MPKRVILLNLLIGAVLRVILIFIFLVQAYAVEAQSEDFNVVFIKLPEELAAAHHEFSGLGIWNNYLYLLSESRIQEGREGKLYRISLSDIDRYLQDTAYFIDYDQLEITNLDFIVSKINNNRGNFYEGLEAMAIFDSLIYISVETENPYPNSYIISGVFSSNQIIIDTSFMITMPKPKTSRGEYIYNAGIEAVAYVQDTLWTFFEFNYFDTGNTATLLSQNFRTEIPLERLPFRLTDICKAADDTGLYLTGINYFYKGAGRDSVYRVSEDDRLNYPLINEQGGWHNFCRLIKINFKNERLSWAPLWNLPDTLKDYNWEGLAAYKSGYFLVNDKYGPAGERMSKLIYLQGK